MTNAVYLTSNDTVEEMIATLTEGRVLRRSLEPGDGRVHIDRLQPFLCVYRRPHDRADEGTGRLLLSQASYILSDAALELQPSLHGFVSRLTDAMVEAYGAALVVELWSAPEARLDEAPRTATTRYRIVAAHSGVPSATIEMLEHALLTDSENGDVQIEIDYRSGAAPPGSPPLLAAAEEARSNVFLLGLEISPIYRDPLSGRLIPGELRSLSAHLGRALRQAFYAFTHVRANYRPKHFHELGRRAMTDAVGDVDRGLAEVGDSFDLILHSTPVNADEAFDHFITNRCSTVPEFLYRPQTVDHGALKYAIYKVPIERIEDPALYHLFVNQRDELDRQITMLADRGTRRFMLESQQLFGGPDGRLLAIAKQILDVAPPDESPHQTGSTVTAQAFAVQAERELAHYRQAWPELPARVEIREDIPGFLVSKGHFLIGHTAEVGEARSDALLHHEVGTHILTYYNGLKQPISQFHTGMPGYEETQEGLAVLSEYLCGGLSSARLRLLAGRVVAVDSLVRGADFIETFRELTDVHGFGQRAAFTIAMRVHRGGGLTKDVVYLRGLISVLDHLATGHPFEDLLIGKVALEYMEIVDELRWRQVVSTGPLRPRYLDDPAARKRLSLLPSGSDVTKLLDWGPQ